MKNYYFLAFLAMLPNLSAANCDTVLNVAQTYYSQYSKEDLQSFVYSRVCSKTSALRESANGLTAAIDDLDLGITSKSSTKDVKSWCSKHSNLFSRASIAKEISVQVDRPTIDAWKSCKAAENDKLKVEVKGAANGRTLQIKLKNNNVSDAQVLLFSSQSDGGMECDLIAAKNENGDSFIRTGQYGYVNCEITKDTINQNMLPSGSVTLNTSVGGFLYSVPKLNLTPPSPPDECQLSPPQKFVVNLKGKIHKSIAYWGAGGGVIQRGPHSTDYKHCDLGVSNNMQVFILGERSNWHQNHKSITCNNGQSGLCDSAGESCSDYSITKGCAVNKDYLNWMKKCSALANVNYDPKSECP